MFFPYMYNSPYKITLPLGLLGYCETNVTTSPTKEVAYRVINILQLLDIFKSYNKQQKRKYRIFHKNTLF